MTTKVFNRNTNLDNFIKMNRNGEEMKNAQKTDITINPHTWQLDHLASPCKVYDILREAVVRIAFPILYLHRFAALPASIRLHHSQIRPACSSF